MRKAEAEAFGAIVRQQNAWMRRAIILSSVLRYLGYDTANIMQAEGEVLGNVLLKKPGDIIHDCQMWNE